MIIGSRQARIGCADVGEIKRQNHVDIIGFEKFVENMSSSILLKMYGEGDRFNDYAKKFIDDSVKQTVSILKSMSILKAKSAPGGKIKLWKNAVPMSPYCEGICRAIGTSLIKHHFPTAYANIMKGEVYSHYSLTAINECVLYTMEFFEKNKMFNEEYSRSKK